MLYLSKPFYAFTGYGKIEDLYMSGGFIFRQRIAFQIYLAFSFVRYTEGSFTRAKKNKRFRKKLEPLG